MYHEDDLYIALKSRHKGLLTAGPLALMPDAWGQVDHSHFHCKFPGMICVLCKLSLNSVRQ